MSNFVDLALLARDNSEVISFFVGSAMKATVLLSFVAVLCLALRRHHAATRHLLWTLALCGSLALPLLSSMLGVWQVQILPETTTVTRFVSGLKLTNEVGRQQRPQTWRGNSHTSSFDVDDDDEAREFIPASRQSTAFAYLLAQQAGDASTTPQVPAAPRLPHWTTLVLAVWLAGASLLLIRLLAGIIGTGLLTSRAAEFGEDEWKELFSALLIDLNLTGKVRLLRSERTLMPMVCGVLRPAVLLPANADEWTEERRRVVLLHELAHVARRDCLTQVLTQMTCSFYWFNPLVWHAARQSRIERERACDDYVLSVGAKPSAYAHHLLEIARSLRSRRTFEVSAVASVAMARRSQLENRLLAILERDGKTQATPRVIIACVISLLCFAVLTIAAVHPTTRAARNIPDSSAASDARQQTIRNSSSVAASVAGSPTQGEMAVQEADRQTSEQEQKRKDEDDREDDSTITQSIEADIERDITQDIEQDIERDVAEDTANLHTTVRVPMPRVDPQINIQVNPDFKFDFNYEQESEQEDATNREEQSSDYIEELASVGYKNLSINQLVQLKTHGVTAAYVKSLRSLGLNDLSVNQISTMRIHGITPAYIEAMRAAGFAELTPSKLATFRIHGVTPEYVKTMRDAGFSNLSSNQLLTFRIHDVTPEFVAGMRAAGYPDLSPNHLTQARIMGVTPQFVRAARSRLGELTINQIIALKQTGIIKDSSDK